MKRLLSALFFVLSLGIYAPSHAGYFVDGNQLLENLNTDARQAARFYAYVSAIVDALDGKGLPEIGCFRVPQAATVGQVADSVKAYLEKNPRYRHMNASYLVVTALVIDYPCK